MRFKEPFAQERISEINNYKPKFLIASEGQVTEPRYFEKLNQSIISNNVTIINILRDYVNSGNSNPKQITGLLKEFLDNCTDNTITVSELKHKISNWNHENPNKIDIVIVNSKLDDEYRDDKYKIQYDNLPELFIYLFRSEVYKDLAENFTSYFMAQDITYSSVTDSINMVIDRDKDSFTEQQYDEVVKFCEENNVNLYISNPNFEFWLYLHFPEIEKEDNELLLKNPKQGQKRYIERRLHDICNYTKTKFSFENFEGYINEAIQREKNYEENVSMIKDNLGTNVGKLVERIINSK
jgi:hypothetical protein